MDFTSLMQPLSVADVPTKAVGVAVDTVQGMGSVTGAHHKTVVSMQTLQCTDTATTRCVGADGLCQVYLLPRILPLEGTH